MSYAGITFAALAATAAFFLIYAASWMGKELAAWNWVIRGLSAPGPRKGFCATLLSFVGRMQESLGGMERISRRLHEKAAAKLGEEDPGRWAWLAAKELCGLAAAAFVFWLLNDWLAAIVAGFGGFWLPDLAMRDRYLRRQEEIRRELPEILELLSLAVEGGMSLDAAFAQVSDKFRGKVLSVAIGRMLGEVRFGARRHQAWREMALRSGSPELREAMATLVQADAMGVQLAQSIKGLARQMRARRRQQVEELAHKAPVKMLFPLVLCIFPAVFLILLGPVFLQLLAVAG